MFTFNKSGKICLISGIFFAIFCSLSFGQVAVPLTTDTQPVKEIEAKSTVSNVLEKIKKFSDLVDHCGQIHKEKGVCPEDVCQKFCNDGTQNKDCPLSCIPNPCLQLDVDHCPTDTCDILDGCDGKKVCYNKIDNLPQACGAISYHGQGVACCPGLVKRCGVEFLDGTCDMTGKNSEYSVAICIPCGNGVCNQFENRCNCPEDCP